MASGQLQAMVLAAAASFALAGCVRYPKPAVQLIGTNQVTLSYRDNYGLLRYESHPTIEASINGVAGLFIIDTGATIPMLTMTGARRCGIPLSSTTSNTIPFWDERVP
jgi:predicted aspartyl protease